MTNLDSILKSRDITLPTKICLVKATVSSIHIWMWELDYKESWALKNWYFWTVMLEKTLESPLDSKEIHLVHPKGNQSWIFTGRIAAEAETPILWAPDVKNWLTGKDPDAGKDWRWEEKQTTEDEMVGWHHRLSGHEFEETLGVCDGQGGLVCCSPCGHKESDTTEQLKWTEHYKTKPQRTSQVELVVKNTPARAGGARILGLILGQEDPLEEEMTTHSSILAWEFPWTEELGMLWHHKESDTMEHIHKCSFIYLLIHIGTPNLGCYT